jgi:hypothetical protein
MAALAIGGITVKQVRSCGSGKEGARTKEDSGPGGSPGRVVGRRRIRGREERGEDQSNDAVIVGSSSETRGMSVSMRKFDCVR